MARSSGDPRSLDKLLAWHGALTHNWLAARIPAAEVDDAVQEVLIRSVDGLDNLANTDCATICALYATLAHWRVMDYVRDYWRRKSHELAGDKTPIWSVDDYAQVEAAAVVTSVLRALPSTQQDLVIYHLYWGVPMEEVAGELGLELADARAQLRDAVAEVRRKWTWVDGAATLRVPSAKISDELWAAIEPLLCPVPELPKKGRPRVAVRVVVDGIVYILTSVVPWDKLPRNIVGVSGPTCYRRLREWQAVGVWNEVEILLISKGVGGGTINWSRVQTVGARRRIGDG